ncbi:MAG TPA: saccharopine dehydrogenase NADP-binding domain-containing protein [Chitinophagaceae bacterium]|jgi:short subunit dehydrogenase-like uncharacterized protein|nr:saccharopine dehydrogenase NADP-binding domain-containing protein [Chitinophagaceae bacterium]
MTNSFLLYGANGYTGELIARYASDYNLYPILAGRREEALKPLATKLNYPYKVFDINDTHALFEALKEVKVVVNAAGPFQFTARQMIEACLQTGTHYLDINGDISVFEMIRAYDTAAKQAGIMLLPGAGFDVVPTDCTALLLKKLLPDASTLKLAFANLGGGLSHGTATTMVNKLGEGGAVRKNGKIIHEPLGAKGMWVDFGIKKLFVMTIPWGDIATAYYSTGIGDVESYTGISPRIYRLVKLQFLFNWLLRTNFIRKAIKKKIDNRAAGPTGEQRSKAISLIWGQVTNDKGEKMTVRMSTPDGYTFTMQTTLAITQKVLQGNLKIGYQTPSTAFGENFVIEFPNVKREIIK